MSQPVKVEDQWRLLLEEGKTTKARQRLAKMYALLPTSSRCRICNVPFAGLSGQLMRALGKGPSNINPHLCNACDTFMRWNPGGMEIRLSMLFADIRGSTSLAEHMNPTEFRHLIDRFYATAIDVLSETDAIIDKLAGDQVSGYYVPGLAGRGTRAWRCRQLRSSCGRPGTGTRAGRGYPSGLACIPGKPFLGRWGRRAGLWT